MTEKESSPLRPKIHLTPEKNWMNDPNGLIYYNGLYHFFYQYFPYDTKWGTMHWGHQTTKDFIHFKDAGVALYPSKLYDMNGCFSGSAIEKDGQMMLYYTAIRYQNVNPENIHEPMGLIASQAMITSKDGFSFDNLNDKRLIIEAGDYGDLADTRDPKVWFENEQYYMVLASRYQDEEKNWQGQLLFYVSQDAKNWQFLNHFRGLKLGDMWECPDIFEADGQRFLLFSPMNTQTSGYESAAQIAKADFDPLTARLTIQGEPNILDEGRDIYAPQTFTDENGNRLFTAWLRMPEAVDGFNGMLIMPRQIEWKDGILYTPPAQKIADSFSRDTMFSIYEPVCIHCEIDEGGAINIGGYDIFLENSILYFDRSKVYPKNGPGVLKVGLQNVPSAALDIYVDGSVIEVFVNGGHVALAHFVYGLENTLNFNMPVTIKGLEKETAQTAE